MYMYGGILVSLQVVELCHAATCVNLEDVMLSEINKSQKRSSKHRGWVG